MARDRTDEGAVVKMTRVHEGFAAKIATQPKKKKRRKRTREEREIIHKRQKVTAIIEKLQFSYY